MTQDLQQKIYNKFLEDYSEFNKPRYIIHIYRSANRFTTNDVDIYNIEINEHDIYSYSFNKQEHHMINDTHCIGMFYARVKNNEIINICKDYLI